MRCLDLIDYKNFLYIIPSRATILQHNKTGKSMPKLRAKEQWITEFLNAVHSDGPHEIAELLTSTHADINAEQYDTKAIHIAVICKKKDTLRFLLKQKPEINGVFCHGRSPLNYAVLANSVGICEMLIKAGANMYEKDFKHRSAVEEVFSKRSMKLARLFLKYLPDPNIHLINGSAEIGSTLLHRAAKTGDIAIVNLLIEHNANVLAVDAVGRTPADLAKYFDHLDLALHLKAVEHTERDKIAMESSTLPGKQMDKTKPRRSI
jgi:ankyrin repeat protein